MESASCPELGPSHRVSALHFCSAAGSQDRGGETGICAGVTWDKDTVHWIDRKKHMCEKHSFVVILNTGSAIISAYHLPGLLW